jgi:hypothetical protein
MEVNPENPLLQASRDLWHKFCGLIMHKAGLSRVEITLKDMEAFAQQFGGEQPAIIVQTIRRGQPDEALLISIVRESVGVKIAAEDREARAKGRPH